MLDALGAFDPGSNPGRPTILLEGEVHRQNVVANFAEGRQMNWFTQGFSLGSYFLGSQVLALSENQSYQQQLPLTC